MSEIEPTINISELDLQALEDAAKLETVQQPSSKYVNEDHSGRLPLISDRVVNIKDFIPRPKSDDLNIGPVRRDTLGGDWFGPFADDDDLARYRPPRSPRSPRSVVLPSGDEGLFDISDFDDDFDADADVDDKLFKRTLAQSCRESRKMESREHNKQKSAVEKLDEQNMEEFLKSVEIGDDDEDDSDNSYIQTTRDKDSQPTSALEELSSKIDDLTEKLHDIESNVEETNKELLEYIGEDKIHKSIRIMNSKIKRIEEKMDLILSRLDSAFGIPPDPTSPNTPSKPQNP